MIDPVLQEAIRISRQALLRQYTSHSTRNPATMATRKTFSAKARTSFFLNMEPRIISSGILAPAPAYDERENRAQSHAFPHKGGTDGNDGLRPDIHGNTDSRRDRNGPRIAWPCHFHHKVLREEAIDKSPYPCAEKEIPEDPFEGIHC